MHNLTQGAQKHRKSSKSLSPKILPFNSFLFKKNVWLNTYFYRHLCFQRSDNTNIYGIQALIIFRTVHGQQLYTTCSTSKENYYKTNIFIIVNK